MKISFTRPEIAPHRLGWSPVSSVRDFRRWLEETKRHLKIRLGIVKTLISVNSPVPVVNSGKSTVVGRPLASTTASAPSISWLARSLL